MEAILEFWIPRIKLNFFWQKYPEFIQKFLEFSINLFPSIKAFFVEFPSKQWIFKKKSRNFPKKSEFWKQCATGGCLLKIGQKMTLFYRYSEFKFTPAYRAGVTSRQRRPTLPTTTTKTWLAKRATSSPTTSGSLHSFSSQSLSSISSFSYSLLMPWE